MIRIGIRGGCIIASQVVDAYTRPTIIMTQSGDGALKGSARSVPMSILRTGVEQMQPGILPKFGGHAMAAGYQLLVILHNFPICLIKRSNKFLIQQPISRTC